MQLESPSRRPRCPDCALPASTCLCALVVRVDNPVDLLVLQHPSEVDDAKGSVRLLSRCLTRCRVVVGEVFDPVELACWLAEGGREPVLLYPGGEGAALAGATQRPDRRLVVLDGTWRKTLRMLAASPLLQRLPRVSLDRGAGHRYAALRRARHPSQSSTLEAACAAMALIDGDALRYEPVLDAFSSFVADSVARIPNENRRRP